MRRVSDASRVDAAKQHLVRSLMPLTLNELLHAIGGARREYYRALRAALVDPSSGIVVVLEERRQRGGARRVWSLSRAVDAGLDFVLGQEVIRGA